MKEFVAALLDGASRGARLVQLLIVFGIFLSVLATLLETVPTLAPRYGSLFDQFELVCTILFSAEILLRLWSAGAPQSPFAPRRWPRLAYLVSPGGIVDLLAVVPYYLGASAFVVVRSLRLLRVFRLAKLARHVAALRLLAQAIRIRRRELAALGVLAALTILISATLMYSAEHDAQPGAFTSMLDALWWALATLTTVGYGDIYPLTALGRACASGIMILGIGLVALPTGLIGSAFYELTQRRACPHCGGGLTVPAPRLSEARAVETGSARERSATVTHASHSEHFPAGRE